MIPVLPIKENAKEQAKPKSGTNISERCSYEEARHHICIRVMNYAHNQKWLEKLPHVLWEDLAVIFVYRQEEGEELITAEDLDLWQVDLYELYRGALIESRSIHPPFFTSMQEFLGLLQEDEEEMGLYILTCKTPFYGSATLFYPGIFRELSEKLGDDLYIIPCSVHELLLVRKKEVEDPGELIDIIRRVNREDLLPGEILSDSLYEYRSGPDLLRRV